MSEDDLIEAVAQAFEHSSQDLQRWPDPHPDRQPDDSEYSRVTDPARYRIVGARADAWAGALVQLGLATLSDRVEWVEPPLTDFRRPLMIVPNAAGARPVVIARHRLEDCEDAGLTLGIGCPAYYVAFVPDCGCDACDSGSRDLIDVVDQILHAIVTGRYRRLSKGEQVITIAGESRSSTNIDRRRADSVLAKPNGWVEINGATWFPPLQSASREL